MEQFLSQMDTYLQGSLLLAMVAAYLGGVLASLTPCVYPMIPITAGVVTHSNLGGGKVRAFLLSLSYVTGMAITYAVLGVFAAATGRFFGAINSSGWVRLVVSGVMFLFGLGMLDLLRLPTIAVNVETRGKGFPGVFLAGLVSGLVAGPCTAPVLGVLLAFVASSGRVGTGALLLFIFAFGMGTLLLAVGTFSGLLATLPRSGNWMVTVRKIMGGFMLVLALYFAVQGIMMLR